MSQSARIYTDINCTFTAEFIHNRWVWLAAVLFSVFGVIGLIGNVCLAATLWPKRFNHPLSNFLLLNSATAAGLLGVAIVGDTVARIWYPLIRGDPCTGQDTVFQCNLSYGLVVVLIFVADASRIVLIVERSVLAVQGHQHARRLTVQARENHLKLQGLLRLRPLKAAEDVKEENDKFDCKNEEDSQKEKNPSTAVPKSTNLEQETVTIKQPKSNADYFVSVGRAQNKGRLCCNSVRSSALTLIWIWITAVMVEFARLSNLPNPTATMAFCTTRNGNFLGVLFASIGISLFFFGLILVTHWLSQAQLETFSTSQLHLTLSERTTLRYNLHLSKTLAPVMVYSLACTLLSSTVFAFSILNQRFGWGWLDTEDELNGYVISLFVFLFFNFTPSIIFGFYCNDSFKRLQEHGPSIVISTSSRSTRAPPTTNNSRAKNDAENKMPPVNGGTEMVDYRRAFVKRGMNPIGDTHFNTAANMW